MVYTFPGLRLAHCVINPTQTHSNRGKSQQSLVHPFSWLVHGDIWFKLFLVSIYHIVSHPTQTHSNRGKSQQLLEHPYSLLVHVHVLVTYG